MALSLHPVSLGALRPVARGRAAAVHRAVLARAPESDGGRSSNVGDFCSIDETGKPQNASLGEKEAMFIDVRFHQGLRTDTTRSATITPALAVDVQPCTPQSRVFEACARQPAMPDCREAGSQDRQMRESVGENRQSGALQAIATRKSSCIGFQRCISLRSVLQKNGNVATLGTGRSGQFGTVSTVHASAVVPMSRGLSTDCYKHRALALKVTRAF